MSDDIYSILGIEKESPTKRSNTAPTASPLSQPEAPSQTPTDEEVETFKKTCNWFVVGENSTGRWFCTKKEFADIFRRNILEGTFTAACTVDVHVKTKDGKWNKTSSSLAQFAKRHFKIGVLYEPVWSHAMAGLKWGALSGIVLKYLDTLFLLGSIDPRMAFLFLVVTGVCVIPRLGMPLVIVVSISLYRFTKANLFITLLAVMLFGSILGCLPGMAIGGAIGFLRRKNLPVASDATPERSGLVWKVMVLPLLGSVIILGGYFGVVNPWFQQILSK